MADNQTGSGAQEHRGKKRSKSYYVRAKEGKRIRRDTMLTVGMRGVMLTCNHGVKPCVKEAYNLLAEYADQLYGPEKDLDEEGEQSPASEDEDDECEDMEASLQKEIAGMKQKSKGRKQRFQAVESGAKNVAFIKSNIEDPCELVHHILTDIQETKTCKSRHIMRMLPVMGSFRSYVEDIEKQAPRILKPHFERDDGQELSFCIMFKVRNCGHLKRDDVITTLHRIVTEMGKHKVDLTNADRVILVEGIRNVCCISVLKDFFKLRKYNLQGITEGFIDNSKLQGKGRWNRKPKKKGSDYTSTDAGKEGDSEVSGNKGNLPGSKSGNEEDGTDGDRECVHEEKVKSEEGQDVSDANNSKDRTIEGEKVDEGKSYDIKNESTGEIGDVIKSENQVEDKTNGASESNDQDQKQEK